MQRFWYHSPVRFYRTIAELKDMTNPQNSQFFGSKNPYPLEIGDYHRYLIPNYNNEVSIQKYEVWCVNDFKEYKIPSVCEIAEGRLKYVTFKSNTVISGRLEIRTVGGTTIYYSNCVSFIDSTDYNGRKFIKVATKERFVRIATQHTYNKNLFDFSEQFNWVITSVPAYCLGVTDVEVDISNSRFGGNSSLKIRESYVDEVVEYQFMAEGDANILNFLQVHTTNNRFFIDGTQRTCIDKLDRSDYSMFGTLRFTNVKEKETGLNVMLDFSSLLDNIFTWVLGDSTRTVVYSDDQQTLIEV